MSTLLAISIELEAINDFIEGEESILHAIGLDLNGRDNDLFADKSCLKAIGIQLDEPMPFINSSSVFLEKNKFNAII